MAKPKVAAPAETKTEAKTQAKTEAEPKAEPKPEPEAEPAPAVDEAIVVQSPIVQEEVKAVPKPVAKPQAAKIDVPVEQAAEKPATGKLAQVTKPVPLPGESTSVRPPAGTGEACVAALERLGAAAAIPKDFTEGPNCTVASPVQIKSVRTRDGVVALPSEPILNCAFAKEFVTWLADVAAPAIAAQQEGALTAVSTGPGYQCRGRNGDSSGKLSEHAHGNAIDIDAMVLSGKKRIAIAVTDPSSPHHRMLMALRVSACGFFTTVLGPGSNEAHATHFHFDLGRHGKSANYRICE